jgi:hypothetical protein
MSVTVTVRQWSWIPKLASLQSKKSLKTIYPTLLFEKKCSTFPSEVVSSYLPLREALNADLDLDAKNGLNYDR